MAFPTITSHTVPVAEVDPADDRITRYVVHRYVYDPTRRERRHVLVAAYDNSREFGAKIDALATDLRQRRQTGDDDVDPREHVSGTVLEPGYHRKQRNGRIIKRAIAHAVAMDIETWRRLTDDLPPGMAVMRFESNPDA
jgi:hypothetical protein